MVPAHLIYCHWIRCWTLLFLFNFVKQSPLPSAILALIYGILVFLMAFLQKSGLLHLKITENIPLKFIALSVFIDILTIGMIIYKIKKPIHTFFKDIYINIFIFSVYLLYLHLNSESIFTIYIDKIPKQDELRGDFLSYF